HIAEWNQKKEAFESAYEVAKGKSQSSQQQLQEIQKIEKRISEINKVIAERKLLLKEIGTPDEEFRTQKRNWEKFHNEKIQLLNEQAARFSDLSKNLIKAEVTKSINLQPLKLQLKNIFEGTRIREERIDAILHQIKESENPIKEYTAIVEEFRLLAELKVSEDKTLKIPETPILEFCGSTEEHKSKIG